MTPARLAFPSAVRVFNEMLNYLKCFQFVPGAALRDYCSCTLIDLTTHTMNQRYLFGQLRRRFFRAIKRYARRYLLLPASASRLCGSLHAAFTGISGAILRSCQVVAQDRPVRVCLAVNIDLLRYHRLYQLQL